MTTDEGRKQPARSRPSLLLLFDPTAVIGGDSAVRGWVYFFFIITINANLIEGAIVGCSAQAQRPPKKRTGTSSMIHLFWLLLDITSSGPCLVLGVFGW